MPSDKKCCVPHCDDSPGLTPLHKFPNPDNDIERFRTWLYAIGGDILGLENEFIHKYRRVCHIHFGVHCVTRGKRLSNIAVPTLHLSNDEVQEENPLGDCPASIMEELPVSSASSPSVQCIEASDKEDAVAAGCSRRAGYRCDRCRGDIVGVRYCCVECRDYALCGACEARGHHAAHYVLRVPWGKPHVEVQAVLENIRNVLFLKEDDNRCELEPEVKMEAPGPDPLAPAASSGPEDQNPAIVEATFVPSNKTEDLELDDTVELELTDEENQETSHSHLVPAVQQPTVPSKRKKGRGDVAAYSGGCGGGFAVCRRSADPPHDTGPDRPDKRPRLVPQCGQGINMNKDIFLSKGVLVVQTVKKDVPSTAKRKTNAAKDVPSTAKRKTNAALPRKAKVN